MIAQVRPGVARGPCCVQRTPGTLAPNARTARRRDYVTVQAMAGLTIEVHYHRAGEAFQANWVLRSTEPTPAKR